MKSNLPELQIARQYWAPYAQIHRPFDAGLIDAIYENELLQSLFSQKKVVVLEFRFLLLNLR